MCDLCLGWKKASITDKQIQKMCISVVARYMLHIIMCHVHFIIQTHRCV